MARTLPTYKAVVKTTHGHNKHVHNVQGGKVMVVNFKETGRPAAAWKAGLRLSDLRGTK